jgi:hypothetical protein
MRSTSRRTWRRRRRSVATSHGVLITACSSDASRAFRRRSGASGQLIANGVRQLANLVLLPGGFCQHLKHQTARVGHGSDHLRKRYHPFPRWYGSRATRCECSRSLIASVATPFSIALSDREVAASSCATAAAVASPSRPGATTAASGTQEVVRNMLRRAMRDHQARSKRAARVGSAAVVSADTGALVQSALNPSSLRTSSTSIGITPCAPLHRCCIVPRQCHCRQAVLKFVETRRERTGRARKSRHRPAGCSIHGHAVLDVQYHRSACDQLVCLMDRRTSRAVEGRR